MVGTALGVIVARGIGFESTFLLGALSGLAAVGLYLAVIILVIEPREPGRGYSAPPPPFKASKRTGWIMNRLWYGSITPDEARKKGSEWAFDDADAERMIADATGEHSYWWWRDSQFGAKNETGQNKRMESNG